MIATSIVLPNGLLLPPITPYAETLLAASNESLARGVLGSGAFGDDMFKAGLRVDARQLLHLPRAEHVFPADNYTGFSGTATQRTAAIKAAIADAVSAGGGEVLIPAGNWTIDDTLAIEASNVVLRGVSRPAYNGTPAATTLTWAGAAGGTMILISPVSDAASKALYGCGVHNMSLNGGVSGGVPIAALGLHICSHQFGHFSGLTFARFSFAALRTFVVATLAGGENKDTQNNLFEGMVFQQHYSGCGYCVHLHGRTDVTLGNNTSFNELRNIIGWHANSEGFVFGNCDMNFVRNLRLWRVSGVKNGIVFAGNADATNVARFNLMEIVFSQGGVYSQGTEATNPATYNEVRFYDTPNGSPVPDMGTGTLFNYSTAMPMSLRGTPGATLLGGNMMMQWGEQTIAADTHQTIVLPFSFALPAYSVTATYKYNSAAAADTAPGAEPGADGTSIKVANTASGARNIMWTAIGLRPNA